MLQLQEATTPREVSKMLLVEETYDVEFDESNGSQGAHENLDDVGDEPLRGGYEEYSGGRHQAKR